jgi:hypothetical protein
MPEEKVLESKVVNEQRVKKNGSARNTIGAVILALSVGAVGYGARDFQFRNGYVGKDLMLRVANHAVQKGYSENVWRIFPENEKYLLMKRELSAMPLEKSWNLVKPTIDKKAGQEYDPVKKDSRFIYNTLKDFLTGEENGNR